MKACSLAVPGWALTTALTTALIASACTPAARPAPHAATPHAVALLPDVRVAKDRPPVVLVARDGDPTGAIAVAVSTSGLESDEEDPEPAVALAGVVEARLASRGLSPAVVPSWSGFRATLLVATPEAAHAVADVVREALTAPIEDKDLAAAKKKLAALASRPLGDAALVRWARCVGSPHARPHRAGKSGDDLVASRLERWRAGSHGLGRVAIAVAAPAPVAEAVATAIATSAAWTAGAPAPAARPAPSSIDVDVYEAAADFSGATTIHATLDVGSASDAVSTAAALGDPRGPLSSRLASLDLPFRLREVTATADPRGGCVGVVLEAAPPPTSSAAPPQPELAARVADAIALVHVEARVFLEEGGVGLDGRTLARRAGDAREAAERAAWWALADTWLAPAPASSPRAMRGSVALGLPLRRGGPTSTEGPAAPSREALASAMRRATLAWQTPVAEGRARVERGQGEVWVLLGSPCGTESETDNDAGLTALFTVAAAELARTSPEARVEPWIVPDGAGLLVHGPAMPGETAAAHARRLADVVARSFASDPVAASAVSRARAALLWRGARHDAPALGALASAIAPGHASWFLASGREETLSRSADAAVLARAQAVRSGPLRVAVLANVDAAQADAALRATDRWIDRRGDAPRACRSRATPNAPRPGTYAVDPRPGAAPEAYIAFPLPAGDERARAAASIITSALEGEGGLLERALGGAPGPGLARAWSARLLGWPRAPALVVRVVASQTSLDAAVMQTRALVDRVRQTGLAPADLERAFAAASRDSVAAALDPRARLVATWRGEPIPTFAQPLPHAVSADDVRAFAARHLNDDAMVVAAARPPRAGAGGGSP